MNGFQFILIFIFSVFFSFGIYNLIRSAVVYKKINHKLFFYAIASLFAGSFVLFELFLSYPDSDMNFLLYHRLKILSLIGGFAFWVKTMYMMFFKESKFPQYVFFISFLLLFFLPFDFFLSLPISQYSVTAFGIRFDYCHATPNLIYSVYAAFIFIVSVISILRILFKNCPTCNKVFAVVGFLVGALGVYDFLIIHGVFQGIMISEFVFLLFIIISSAVFFREEEEHYRLIINMNTELEKKIKERTRELQEVNEKLLTAATTDMLTGVYNRHELERRLNEEASRVMRYGGQAHSNFSILFIDMDNFKYYNDTFGHHVGDLILVEFAKILRSNARTMDIVARFGGDEFIVVLPETSRNNAVIVAIRVQEELAHRKFFIPEIESAVGRTVEIPQEFQLSSSIGITEYKLQSQTEVAELLIQADKALYEAKRAGKNRYVVWQDLIQ